MEDEEQEGSCEQGWCRMTDRLTRWSMRVVKLSDMKPMPDNARTMSDSSLAALEICVEEFGYVEPIVWNKRTGHIIGGHQRHSVLKDKGVLMATVVVVDIPEEQEAEANLSLNNPKIEGRWDDTASALIEKVEEAEEGLFKALRMDKLRDALEQSPPERQESGLDGDIEEYDTECPCCGNKWNIEASDISIEAGET